MIKVVGVDELKRALEWHKQAVPNPTIESACVQIGADAEECAELFEALGDYDISEKVSEIAEKYKSCTHTYAHWISIFNEYQKTQILDALCDKIVTAAGVAHSLGFDLIGALKEVNDSNYSKFEDGKPVFNEQGKISKGVDYKPPQLERFIKG